MKVNAKPILVMIFLAILITNLGPLLHEPRRTVALAAYLLACFVCVILAFKQPKR